MHRDRDILTIDTEQTILFILQSFSTDQSMCMYFIIRGTVLVVLTITPLKPGWICPSEWLIHIPAPWKWWPLTSFWWPNVWECIYMPSHLFQPWRGQQAPLEMQCGCHWPSRRSILASLVYQQADRKGKTGPSLIWRNAVSARVTWAPGENATWMTDISLLSTSINHNP